MDFISSIVGKIIDYSVGLVGEQFGYLVLYKSSIATLKEKFERIREKNEAVQQSVNGAQWNQEVVASEVETWLTKVEKKIEEIQKFLEEDVKANTKCLNGWCPDLKLRYSLGKKAQKNTRAIVELLDEEGGKYGRVYNPAPPREVRSSSTDQWFKDFESRKSTIQNVLNDLKNEDIDMIALWGMGGIGKTKMAKEIKRIVESDKLFHKVAFATVSQNPSLTKIQDELAESLGTRLRAEFSHTRANELYSILDQNKKVLLILDDVWKRLDIEDIGVYRAIKEKSCKILLTTRNEETCNGISIQPKIFPVELLSEEEAWNLFKEMAGDCINASDLISIAKQVAKECARLPLAIAVVGSALRTESNINEWKAVLQQLESSRPQDISDLQAKVYSNIGFSYDYLGSDEAKSCFLLCCLYPEDYDVPIEHLVRYGVAKRFFEGYDTVENTRLHVHAIVQNLRRSNLLLDSNKDECVKMHDVVRDVAISIASKEENGFMVELNKGLKDWPPTDRSYDSYIAISLLLGEMKCHPNELKCPKLQLLRLSGKNLSEMVPPSSLLLSMKQSIDTFPDNLFNEMKELKMLSLEYYTYLKMSLPPSMQILQNLQMLHLEDCCLKDVSAIGTLGNLEILGFLNSKIEELPWEIGNLSRLKLLDMRGCYSLKRIAAGVLSRLSRLEELYVKGFKNWGCATTMEENGEVTNNNASLAELIPYSNQLVVLEISVPSIKCFPKELHFSNSDFRFQIEIGDIGDKDDFGGKIYLSENTLKLKVEDASDLGEHRTIHSLLKKAVGLHFDIAKNSKHIWFEKVQKGINSPYCLKHLRICTCEDLEYLLEATSNSTPPNTFHRLVSLSLNNLPRLIGICNSTESIEVEGGGITTSTAVAHKLFSSNTILWVPNLEVLKVKDCGSLEVVFDLEALKVLENRQPFLAVLSNLNLRNLSGMVHVWKNIPPRFQGFQNLVSINIKKCHSLRILIPASIVKLLVQLQVIEIDDCNLMENIIQMEYEAREERREDILSSKAHSLKWPSIKSIELQRCPKLKTFGSEVKSGRNERKMDAELDPRGQEPSVVVPNLKVLEVEDCGSLEVVFDLEALKVLENRQPFLAVLSNLNLRYLSGMVHVWKNIPPRFQGFQNLVSINIKECHSLRILIPASIVKLLVQLQVIEIVDCNLMENIIQMEYEAREERREDILSSKAHSLKWPSIKYIELQRCPKLKTFGSEVKSGRNERKMDAELDPRGQEPSAGSSSTRESSGLFNRWIESCVPHRRNYSPSQGNSSSSLGENKNELINKKITLTKQDQKQNVRETENQTKMLSLFPHNLIESLQNLQQLYACECDSLEVIFELEGLNAEESNIFNNLTVLELRSLPELLHIWKKGPREIKGFNYLKHLEVRRCYSLKCLFPPSIAKLLVKLEKISVFFCTEMEEILAKESGDEENRDVIAFPLVRVLALQVLPKLECFYTEDNHAFEWPSLEIIHINGCSKLKMFVSTSTKTPKLKGVRGSKTFQPMIEGDLNATIQHIIKEEGFNDVGTVYEVSPYF